MPVWILILLVVIFVVFLSSIVLYYIQDMMLFQVEKLPRNFEFRFGYDFKEIFLNTSDGEESNGILIKAPHSKGLVIYYHNQSGNLKYCGALVNVFIEQHYDVLMMDYRGFGKSTGAFDEALMYEDAHMWYNYAKELGYNESDIVLYGRGLGCAFVSNVASENKPKAAVLESPFYTLKTTAFSQYPYAPMRLVLKYKFDNAKDVSLITSKLYIIHGKKNEINKHKNSELLMKVAPEGTELVSLDEGTHFNLRNLTEYQIKMQDILQ